MLRTIPAVPRARSPQPPVENPAAGTRNRLAPVGRGPLRLGPGAGWGASAAGVAERTLFRWRTEPVFRQALAAAEGELLDAATRRLLTLQEAAIQTFQDVLSDAQTSPGVRVRAAQAVLDYLLKIRMLRDVEQRLTAMEEPQQRRPHW